MKPLRVALAQIAPRLGEVPANIEIHRDTCRAAVQGGADVVVFPELSLTGYLLRDDVPDVASPVDSPILAPLLEVSREVDIVFGFVEEAEGHRYYNAAAYASAGRILHVHRKLYLPTYGMFDEGRDFAAGERLRGFRAPFGPAGLLICEDAWHSTCAWLLAQEGAEVLFILSSGPSRGAKPGRGVTSVGVWTDLVKVTAEFQTAFVVYVNRVGFDDGLNFGGGSVAVDPFGRTVVSLPPLEDALAFADLDPEVLRRARSAYPLLRDENLELVQRELDRIRRTRYGLPDEPAGEATALRRRSMRR